jgi:hypothetical protein
MIAVRNAGIDVRDNVYAWVASSIITLDEGTLRPVREWVSTRMAECHFEVRIVVEIGAFSGASRCLAGDPTLSAGKGGGALRGYEVGPLQGL